MLMILIAGRMTRRTLMSGGIRVRSVDADTSTSTSGLRSLAVRTTAMQTATRTRADMRNFNSTSDVGKSPNGKHSVQSTGDERRHSSRHAISLSALHPHQHSCCPQNLLLLAASAVWPEHARIPHGPDACHPKRGSRTSFHSGKPQLLELSKITSLMAVVGDTWMPICRACLISNFSSCM